MRYLLLSSLFILIVTGCSVTTYNRTITQGKIENPDIVITAEDKSSTRYNSLEMPDRDLPKAYRQALYHGAKHVRIKVANNDKELFGVLALDKADDEGVGPSTQSYKIIVPQPYIDAAKNGKISVVFEYYKLKNDGLIDVGKIKERSWILWLSDQDVFK